MMQAQITKQDIDAQQAKQLAIAKRRRHARIFRYPSSAADERFFKTGIAEWITLPIMGRPAWQNMLFSMIFKRNNDGRTCKYLYFNERVQRLYIDREFDEWARDIYLQQAKLLNVTHG